METIFQGNKSEACALARPRAKTELLESWGLAFRIHRGNPEQQHKIAGVERPPKHYRKYDIEISTLLSIKTFIDNLEVKEVDLDIKQRIEECPYRQIGCTMYNGHILECRGACSWVVDYPKLKELKAQKGE